MSSHKEAPAISQDPVADSTDVYAFVSPDKHDTVTILANYVPLQDPDGGPNFFEFGAKTKHGKNGKPAGEDVLYEIHIVNDDSGKPSITYEFRFVTTILHDSFLYNTGPIKVHGRNYSATWNRPQSYSVVHVNHKTGKRTHLKHHGGEEFHCPPCNVGVRSTPDYHKLSAAALYTASDGTRVFAGQRAEGFFVDLGSIFDLGDLRPISADHAYPPHAARTGINSLADKNVHTIALQIPIHHLTHDGSHVKGAHEAKAVIGVYTTASRQKARMFNPDTGVTTASGPYEQVSRLGSPLVNEVVVPMGKKDYFNSQPPSKDKQFAGAVEHPELQKLLPVLYPGAFPHLKKYKKARADLVAIFATGIPGSVIGKAFGHGTYQGGKVIAEMLRLNMGIKPTGRGGKGKSDLGLLGGDLAGYPNGRRVTDDVVTISLKAVAGATIGLVDKSYKEDAAVALVSQGVKKNPRAYKDVFPYLADPHGGYSNPSTTPSDNEHRHL
jgi:Domain of unknown function (DUF4331)